MSLTMIGITGIIALVAMLFLLATPVSFAMAVVGFIGFSAVTSLDAGTSMVSTVLWGTFSKYSFTLIPLFIFMGQIVFHSGVNQKLYNAAYKCIGHISGGLAMATIAACAAFASICGSNTATAATMTTVAYPEMKKYKYDSMLSLGSIACGSTLGVVIPPSVVLIIIGLSTEQSVTKLFYGGIGAGLFVSLALVLTVYIICRVNPAGGPAGPKFSFKERITALLSAYEMIILFLLVILGLHFGVFTPTEAGAVGAFLAMLLGIVQRNLTLKGLIKAIEETIRASCMVITLVAGAMIFGRFLAVTRIPYELAEWVSSLAVPSFVVMAAIFSLYILGGAMMDSLGLLLITIPIFFPVADKLGYDPLWFGVIITVITTLGAITPPVGATTFVVGAMAKDENLKTVFKGVLYFIPTYVLCIILMTAFPKIITLLPAFMDTLIK
ncbi:Neu5Ac permease [Limihaloglobus sulfuriphilus]|uniref:Neu5Ac permease n=1 Tax=Limihaloglobus sulfuriphilus TaxID=1851148 RepID=A0A1Q2MID2_9BACT|nr:TRAP transporter large permease [Limihaloglobus sulfuriphilus]AQQ72424.1 Neu5Ac permease [Limihaloglobus sulfuriphilus]